MATKTATLTPEQFHRITKALSDPKRYEILQRIYTQDCSSCSDASCDLGISAPTISHHLRELEIADLIQVGKDGRYKTLQPRRDIWNAYLSQLNSL